MSDDTADLRSRILDYIAEHPDCTSDDAAVALGLDPDGADVTACYLMQDGLIYQTGKRETERGLRPTYRVKNHGGQ